MTLAFYLLLAWTYLLAVAFIGSWAIDAWRGRRGVRVRMGGGR